MMIFILHTIQKRVEIVGKTARGSRFEMKFLEVNNAYAFKLRVLQAQRCTAFIQYRKENLGLQIRSRKKNQSNKNTSIFLLFEIKNAKQITVFTWILWHEHRTIGSDIRTRMSRILWCAIEVCDANLVDNLVGN